MKDVHDANLSFWSPQPFFIGGFFFPQQLIQLAWLYRLYKLDPRKSDKDRKEVETIVDFVPYYAVGNLCIATWMVFWNSSNLKTSNIFVVINSLTQLYYIFARQPPMNTKSTSSVLTHIVSKTFAGIGVLDLLHNGSVAYFNHEGPSMAVKVVTGLIFGGLASGSDWIFGGCLVYDLIALTVGQRQIGQAGWSNLLGRSVGAPEVLRPPYVKHDVVGYEEVTSTEDINLRAATSSSASRQVSHLHLHANRLSQHQTMKFPLHLLLLTLTILSASTTVTSSKLPPPKHPSIKLSSQDAPQYASEEYPAAWIGHILYPPLPTDIFTWVFGSFVVPNVTAFPYGADGHNLLFAWVGLDNGPQIVQAGIYFSIHKRGNGTSVTSVGFAEWLPDFAEKDDNQEFPFEVVDQVTVLVQVESPVTATCTLGNVRTGKQWVKTIKAPDAGSWVRGAQVEWVVEEQIPPGMQVADFKMFKWSNCRAGIAGRKGYVDLENAMPRNDRVGGSIRTAVVKKGRGEFDVVFKKLGVPVDPIGEVVGAFG
ncbi:hypothetical protein M7I_2532 [Glarea lozoyensis 74030]|uniref:Concanavalin A-like lectins/glucanase n=1 Tax=Glarea lozoyensis (strain ATCC 74030 / MF5533) TaxID=1104152 RepID=H0EJ09_GLAL7|nr:hypothetical protein M7I_2532 [Glarea lozoyensis 74030]